MIRILNIGTRTRVPSRTSAHILVAALLLPKTNVNSPIGPVPGCRLKYLESRRPPGRDINSHCTFSKVAAIVAVRNKPVIDDKTLRRKMVLLLELYRKRIRDATVASEAYTDVKIRKPTVNRAAVQASHDILVSDSLWEAVLLSDDVFSWPSLFSRTRRRFCVSGISHRRHLSQYLRTRLKLSGWSNKPKCGNTDLEMGIEGTCSFPS